MHSVYYTVCNSKKVDLLNSNKEDLSLIFYIKLKEKKVTKYQLQ